MKQKKNVQLKKQEKEKISRSCNAWKMQNAFITFIIRDVSASAHAVKFAFVTYIAYVNISSLPFFA